MHHTAIVAELPLLGWPITSLNTLSIKVDALFQRHADKAKVFLLASLASVQRLLVHVKSNLCCRVSDESLFTLHTYISAVYYSRCLVFLLRPAALRYQSFDHASPTPAATRFSNPVRLR
jgi:hypothetical protein